MAPHRVLQRNTLSHLPVAIVQQRQYTLVSDSLEVETFVIQRHLRVSTVSDRGVIGLFDDGELTVRNSYDSAGANVYSIQHRLAHDLCDGATTNI